MEWNGMEWNGWGEGSSRITDQIDIFQVSGHEGSRNNTIKIV